MLLTVGHQSTTESRRQIYSPVEVELFHTSYAEHGALPGGQT